MARRLILIMNDGGPSNFLPGVRKDHDQYLRFFQSRIGGAYSNNEIVEFYNYSMSTLSHFSHTIDNLIRNCDVDRLLIVFCGHGYARFGETYLCFNERCHCSINTLKSLCLGARTLLIADSCRCVDLTSNRRSLRVDNPIFNVAYATRYRCFAEENIDGGIYSQNLIYACKWYDRVKISRSIHRIHRQAKMLTQFDTDYTQNPEIQGRQITLIRFKYV